MAAIRLAIADDHQLFRDGLRQLFSAESDIELVAEAGDFAGVQQFLKAQEIDVLLLDLEMPGTNGIEILAQVRSQFPAVRVLIVSMHLSDTMVERVVAAGAAGYVLKTESRDTLIHAVHTVAAGNDFHSAEVDFARARMGLDRTEKTAQVVALAMLSDREREVLKLIAEGYTSQQIGERLFISARTVDTHRNALLTKLCVHNKAGLITIALRAGLVQ